MAERDFPKGINFPSLAYHGLRCATGLFSFAEHFLIGTLASLVSDGGEGFPQGDKLPISRLSLPPLRYGFVQLC